MATESRFSSRLLKASVFKPVFATIEHGLVLRGMGRLGAFDIKTPREIISKVFG